MENIAGCDGRPGGVALPTGNHEKGREKIMAGPCCDNCVYSVCDPQLWRRLMWTGEPILPRCANHPWWPGQLREIPGVACRNYRPKPVLPEGDDIRLIPLGDGHYAYVDAADYEWLSRYNWRLVNGYACRRDKGISVLMHREIMQPPRGMVVDHIDCNRVNNCRFNLRVCTPAENQLNQRKRRGSRSRFKGVYYDKRYRKWRAECRFAGKRYRLGLFDDEVEAARAYDRAAVECFGIFARVNFPKEWPPERRAEVYAAAKTEREKAERKEGKKARTAKPRATSKPALAKTGGRQGVKRAQGKKATGRDKKPHAQTQGRRGRKNPTKARKSECKEVRTTPKVVGGARKPRKRKR